jgi:hypothetical protein
MRTERTWVDAATAERWLECNHPNNRPVPMTYIQNLSDDMLGGRYIENPQPIVFGTDGYLYDGQGRLGAIVHSGVGQWLWVTYDAPPETLHVLDIGRVRRAPDLVRFNTGRGDTHLSAAARLVMLYDRVPGLVWVGAASRRITKPDQAIFTEQNLDAFEALRQTATAAHRETSLAKSAAMAAAFILDRDSRQTEATRTKFWEGVISGANLARDDPRLALRRYTCHDRNHAWRSQAGIAVTLRAWNGWVEGQPMKMLRFRQDQLPMPKPL